MDNKINFWEFYLCFNRVLVLRIAIWLEPAWMKLKRALYWPPEIMLIRLLPMSTQSCGRGLSRILHPMFHNMFKYSGTYSYPISKLTKLLIYVKIIFPCVVLGLNINCMWSLQSMLCARMNSNTHCWLIIAHVPELALW